MREFKHPNMDSFVCPICKSSADEPIVLVPIPGTEIGDRVQVKQIHAECYKLFMKMHGIVCDEETLKKEI